MIKRKEELIMNNVKYDGVYYPVREVSDLKDMIVKSAELSGGARPSSNIFRPNGQKGCGQTF